MRQFSAMIGGGPGERADYLQRLAPSLEPQVQEQDLDSVYEKIDLPLAPVLAEIERTGVAWTPKTEKMSRRWKRKCAAWKKKLEAGGIGIQRQLADAAC